MADKTIGSLPKATAIYDDSAFVMEQNGHAMQTDSETMKDYFFGAGTNNLIVTVDTTAMTADKTSSEIFGAIEARKGVKMYLHEAGGTDYTGADFIGVSFDSGSSEFTALFSARVETSRETWQDVTYVVGGDGSVSVYDTDESVSTTRPSVIAANAALSLRFTPTANNHAVNRAYVDQAIQEVRETGVYSVNGKTGEVTLTASDVGALPDDTPIPSKTSELSNDSGFITSVDVPAPPVQSVNGKTGEVTVREVPGYASAAASAVLTKLSDGSIGWAILQELPEPSLDAVEQWVASLDPDAFDAVSQIYNFFLDQDYWNETTDGDIRYFYSSVANAIRTGDVLTELKRSAAAGETGKIAMLLDGEWKVIIPPYVTSQTAPVRSVNGKTGDVTIDVPSVPQSDIAANTAARHTHDNKETLDAIPNKSGAETGQILMKSEDGIEWADIDPVPSAESATIGSVLTKTGNGNVYNWRIVQGLTVRLKCDTAFIDSDPDLAEVESNISGLRTANDIGLSITSGVVGTAELYDVGNSNEWIAYRLYKVTYDFASKNYGLVFEHAEEGQVKYAELYGTSRIPSFYTRQYSRVPAVTTEDEGKILKVVNGEPVWVSP